MAEEVRKLSVIVTMDEEGRIGVQAPKQVPVAFIVGMLEFGKQLFLTATPEDEVPQEDSGIVQ